MARDQNYVPDHTQTIFVAPRALTADQVKDFTERAEKCAEDGKPLLLGLGWGVYSGPPWQIHPSPEHSPLPAALAGGEIICAPEGTSEAEMIAMQARLAESQQSRGMLVLAAGWTIASPHAPDWVSARPDRVSMHPLTVWVVTLLVFIAGCVVGHFGAL